MKHHPKGFTLIELLAVIAIIGILSALAAISISNATKRARDAQRQRDLSNLKTALELFSQDNGSYPTKSAFDRGDALKPTYIKTMPVDPRTRQNYAYYLPVTLPGGTIDDYAVEATLEYRNAKATLTGVSCGQDGTHKGNGVVAAAGTAAPCFRVTND